MITSIHTLIYSDDANATRVFLRDDGDCDVDLKHGHAAGERFALCSGASLNGVG
jgi:hypothetical protein